MTTPLTIRVMLAYLDDLLPADQASDIGRRIAESNTAQAMVERIRRVYPRSHVDGSDGSPVAAPRTAILPANDLAEYLDRTLAGEKVTELERRCVEDDRALAEVVFYHQLASSTPKAMSQVGREARERVCRAAGQQRGAATHVQSASGPMHGSSASGPMHGSSASGPMHGSSASGPIHGSSASGPMHGPSAASPTARERAVSAPKEKPAAGGPAAIAPPRSAALSAPLSPPPPPKSVAQPTEASAGYEPFHMPDYATTGGFNIKVFAVAVILALMVGLIVLLWMALSERRTSGRSQATPSDVLPMVSEAATADTRPVSDAWPGALPVAGISVCGQTQRDEV